MYTSEQCEAMTKWVQSWHECIANYYSDDKNEDCHNLELYTNWKNAIEISPIYRGIVYRGVCANEYRPNELEYVKTLFNLSIGETFSIKKPCSASISKNIGKIWSKPKEVNKDFNHISVLLELAISNGRDIRNGPKHKSGDEKEIVLMPTVIFRVTKVNNIEEIPSEGNGLTQRKVLSAEEIEFIPFVKLKCRE